MTKQRSALLAGAVVLAGLSSFAQPVGQWDFNLGNLTATVGTQPLETLSAETQAGIQYGTTTTFGIPDIGGAPALVAKLSGWTTPDGIRMPVSADQNGDGSLVNRWTYVVDLLFPAESDAKWRALLETDNRVIEADGDIFVNPGNGLGIGGAYQGNVTAGAWHRIAIAVDANANTMHKYIDGKLVGIQGAGGLDGRFSLSPRGFAELFTDNDGEVAPAFVNSIQLWSRALNSGEIAALGGISAGGLPQTLGPVPAFIASSSPGLGAVDVHYLPDIHVDLNTGASVVTEASIRLLIDSKPVAATVAGIAPNYTIDFTVVDPLEPNEAHVVGVVYSENGTTKTNSFSFTVANYQKITLPEPFLIENFDLVDEGSIPTGWTRTNRTQIVASADFEDLDNLNSNSYLDWTVVSRDRLAGLKSRIFNINTVVLNGVLQDVLADGNMLYAESDVRSGSQVQMVFTKDFDLTGKRNVFLGFKSMYEQNQDNINSVEYSIDGGATWLPALYLIDRASAGGDIIYSADGSVDAVATMNTIRGDTAYGTSYGAYIGAPISQALAPYISGRVNDDSRESKRIEVIRLFAADNQPTVRLRFMQAGTASWYWGVDDVAFYSIPEPRIVFSPTPVTVNFDGTATLKVVASGDATLAYQWYQDGQPVPNGTGATLTLTRVTGASQGNYNVKVSNSLGEATSGSARVTVLLSPVVSLSPQPVLASAGAPFSLEVEARGQSPFSYQWKKGGENIPNATSSSYVVAAASVGDSGDYSVTITNPSGNTTTTPVKVTVLPLIPITQDLVAHYPFDTDANDTSGRSNHGTPEVQPEIVDGVLPTYSTTTKQIGAGALRITEGQHIALGAPEDFDFGSEVNFTVSFWARGADANAWTGDPSFFGNKHWQSGGNPGLVVSAQGGGAWKWTWKANVGPRQDSANVSTLTDGNFHNIVISHDRNGFAYFYMDGILRQTLNIAGAGDINALSYYIAQDGTGRYGFNNDLGARFKDIQIDDFGIWRRLLTPQEAASIYANGKLGNNLTQASGVVVVLAPNITASPANAILSVGGSATLSATVAGTAPFTYDWRKDGATVATTKTLALNSVTASAAGDYQLIVRNSAGSSTSSVARVAVVTSALNQDLVAHVKLDGDYQDASGRGNHAAPRGNPTFESGKFGQSMRFTTDGPTIDYATFGGPADLQFGESDFSVSMWVNWTASADDLPFISNKDWNSSSNIGWGVFSQGGGNTRINATGTPRGSGNRMNTSATPNIRDGNWHNVVVSFWRGKTTFTYVDGVLVDATPLVITGSVDAGFAVNIGQDGTGTYTDSGAVHMTARIDDVGLWRRALSAQEAARIASAPGDLSTLSPVPLRISSVVVAGGQVNLTITGAGVGARLQKRASLSAGVWEDAGAVTGAATVTVTGSEGYFRVVNP